MINYDKTPSSWIIIFIFENNKERTEKIFDNNECDCIIEMISF